jgi:tape measure domain-containing protein
MAISQTDIGIRVRANIEQARRAFARLGATVKANAKSVDGLLAKFRGIDRFWALMIAGTMTALVVSFGRMAAEMQKVQFQIAAFSDGFERVPEVMKQVLTLAKSVPFDIDSITKTFVRLKASGIDPIIDAEGNGPLRNLMDAVAAFGGGPEIFQRAGIAIQQMAGKGVISMEELRQQLGEAVPTAMRVMAEQLDVSVGSMIQTISKGQLSFSEGFAALNKGFEETFGGLSEAITEGSFLGQVTQIKNRFQELANVFVEGGGLNVFTAALRVLGNELQKFTDLVKASGTQIQDDLIAALEKAAPTVDAVVNVLGAFASILGDIISLIASVVASVPPEIITGGIIGFFLLGKFGMGKTMGAAVGILIASFPKIFASISGMIKDILAVVPPEIVSNGFIAWFFFGKKGILFIVPQIVDAVKKLITIAMDGLFALVTAATDALSSLFSGADSEFASFSDRWKKKFDEFQKDSEDRAKGQKKFWDGVWESVFGPDKAAESGAAAGQAGVNAVVDTTDMGFDEAADALRKKGFGAGEGVGSAFVDGVKNQLRFVLEAMKNIRLSQPDNRGGLRIQDIALFEKLNRQVENLRTKTEGFGGPLAKNVAIMNKELIKFDDLLLRIKKDMDLAASEGKLTGKLKEGFVEARRDVQKLRGEWTGLVGALNIKIRNEGLKTLNRQLDRTSEALDTMDTSGSQFDRTIEKIENRFSGLRLRLKQIETGMLKFNDGSQIAKDALAAVRAEIARLDRLKPEAIFEATAKNIRKMNDQIQQANQQVRSFNNQLEVMKLKLAGDEVGLAGLAIKTQVDAQIKAIESAITKTRETARSKGGLVPDDVVNNTIANMERIKIEIGEVGEKLKKQAEFAASSFGQFAMSVGQSVEDALADSFENLVTGAKSAKDVVLDFYDAITKAAARYLAQEAMLAMFGKGQGSGPSAGRTGFAQMLGSFFGFQHGGQFVVGGTGGPDSQMVAFKASPGEAVTVTPPGGMQGGGGDTFIINALDQRSIQQLLLEQGDVVAAALRQRGRLNKA